MRNNVQLSNDASKQYKKASRPEKTLFNTGIRILANGFQLGKNNKELRQPIDDATHEVRVGGKARILYKILELPPRIAIGSGVTILGASIEIIKIFTKGNHKTTE